jgi:hypothetical protein
MQTEREREGRKRESWKRREELTVSYGRIKASAVATRQLLYQHYRLSLQITRTHGLARNGHVAFDCAPSGQSPPASQPLLPPSGLEWLD